MRMNPIACALWRVSTLAAALVLGAPTWAQNNIVPTAPHGDNSNKAASTAFVQDAVGTAPYVTSVGLALPSAMFTVTNSPVTSSGTLTATFVAQNANCVWAGPASGAPSATACRPLVTNDLPASGITPASYGTATQAPQCSFDVKGRATSCANIAIAPPFSAVTGQVALAQLPTIGNNTVLGNVSGGNATPLALTPTQLTTLCNTFSSVLGGCVPASGGGAFNFLRADGAWAALTANATNITYTPPGTGAVPMTQQQVNNYVFYATGYGATCNGSDEAAALQRAFTAVDSTGGTLIFPPGACVSSTALTLSGNTNVVLQFQGRGQSLLQFIGSTGGIKFGSISSGWLNTSNSSRPFFAVKGVNIMTNQAGLHDAIDIFCPYIGSSQLSNFEISDVNIQPQNSDSAAQYFNNGVYIYNCWRGVYRNVTVDQSVNKLSGSAFFIDGLAPALSFQHATAQWWDRAYTINPLTMSGFTGTISGAGFQYAELVTGPSGCQRRVARVGSYGAAQLVTIAVNATACLNGETLTGSASGTTISSIVNVAVLQANEGLYWTDGSEAILNNYAVYINNPAGVVSQGIGFFLSQMNISCYVTCLYGRNVGQIFSTGVLSYTLANNAIDFDIANFNLVNITNTVFASGGTTGTTAIKLATGDRFVMGGSNTITDRNVGLQIAADVTVSSYPDVLFFNVNAPWANSSPIAPTTLENLLINPGGALATRFADLGSAQSIASANYYWDNNYILTETASVNANTQTDLAASTVPYLMRITQTNAVAQHFGIVQPLDNNRSVKWRSLALTLSVGVRFSVNATVKYALLGWTGTADTITRNVVNNWASTNYTAGNFFVSSNVSVIAIGTCTPTINVYSNCAPISAAVPASVNNLMVMAWPTASVAQSQTFDLRWKLEPGYVGTPFSSLALADEMRNAQEQVEKTADYGSSPNVSSVTGSLTWIATITGAYQPWQFKVPKLKTGCAATVYSPGTGASGQIRNTSSSTDLAAQFGNVGKNNAVIQNTAAAAAAVYSAHALIDCGL